LRCCWQGEPTQGALESLRRREFLQQLHNRLAQAHGRQQHGSDHQIGQIEPSLKHLVTKHGVEDWMQVGLFMGNRLSNCQTPMYALQHKLHGNTLS